MSDIENKINFEDKIVDAKDLLDKLLDPNITLSNSVTIYKDGIKKLTQAQKLLDEAKLDFEELNIKKD
jgi:exodeoxyribonuclease VII small subunit